jgi:hypothetical protein
MALLLFSAVTASSAVTTSTRADILGVRWDEVEIDNWRGDWARRGSSNVFDARWTHPSHGVVTATLTMQVDRNNNVTIIRRDISATVQPPGWAPGRGCVYRGSINPQTAIAAGTYRCDWDPRQPQWRAQIVGMTAAVGSNLVGAWRGCDGRVTTFTYEDGIYVGRYTALGGLGRFRFTLGEIGHRVRLQADGRYVGEAKWRWTDGSSKWMPIVITVSGDTYHDSGSDECARNMTRVRAILR